MLILNDILGFNNVMGNPDLTLLDPAIVSMPPTHGGLGGGGGGRADSPLSNNSWLPSSAGLDQHFPPSSSEMGSNGFGKTPLPAFAGLSLSSSSSSSAHQRWNGTGAVTAGDRVGHGGPPPPPPGFNLGRMPPHQPPQSSFPNMNLGNSDGPPHHQIENKGFF